ncbi:CbtB-domain containing protein [Jiella sp. CQZ9-1]|uniref:CbtB-domain containing protein n=2 Tax=Jiella flava TaxID=2816857 RepID=A0A939JX00_9HYPH|nr:CbtB-domain containing protein [Jiella flava]
MTITMTHSGVMPATTRIAGGLLALALGAFFIWGAGFAHAAALHDTAHDVRHAFGFPCH